MASVLQAASRLLTAARWGANARPYCYEYSYSHRWLGEKPYHEA